MPRKTKETLIEENKDINPSSKGEISIQKNAIKNVIKKESLSKVKPSSKKGSSVDKKIQNTKSSPKKDLSSAKKMKTTTSKKSSAKLNMEYLTEYYDLPNKYNKTTVKILSQTPKTLFVYWEISDEDKSDYIKNYGKDFFNKTRPVLLIYNKTKNYSFEIGINDFANSWYFDVVDEACEYSVELGRRPVEGLKEKINLENNYLYITSSNEIESPNGHILFDKSAETIYFRNVKSNQSYTKDIANLQFMKHISKIYNLSDFYKVIYKKENIFDINNPTSK